MAGIDMTLLRAAIKDRIDAANITDGNGRKLAVFAYQSQNRNTQYPCAIIRYKPSAKVDFVGTFGPDGLMSLELEVEFRAQSADDLNAEILIDQLLGVGNGVSAWEALFYVNGEPEPSFGGLVDSAVSIEATSPSLRADGSLDRDNPTRYVGLTFQMSVHKSKG